MSLAFVQGVTKAVIIVGTAVKRDAVLANPVDPRRVRQLVEAARIGRG